MNLGWNSVVLLLTGVFTLYSTIMSLHHATPLFYAHRLSAALQKHIHFKMDCYQPTGSFKIRGIGQLCEQALAEGYKALVIASGGNAGLATAYAGWKLGLPTTVVLPTNTPLHVQANIRVLGAKVILHGAVWDEANVHALTLADTPGTLYVPPFDHPTLWDGHASVIEECAAQLPEPDLVLVAVGGGGYFLGVLEGLKRVGWEHTQIYTAETEGADALYQSIQQKAWITLPAITSVATSLGAKQVAHAAYQEAQQTRVSSYRVSDAQAVAACSAFLNDMNVLVEPACGAALAAVYEVPELVADAQNILVLVCGGRGFQVTDLDL